MQERAVLVIDDDPRCCELIAAILTHAGFKVLSAPDGLSGIQTARRSQPAAILLDMTMPGLDGIKTCERLKREPILMNIPVVGMTASTDLTYTGRAFRAGAKFFLSKPFSRPSLVRVVQLAVETAKPGASNHRDRPHPRFPAELPVQCLISAHANGTRQVVGTTGNVSLSGLLLLLPEKLQPGSVFGLRLGLPERTVPAEGKVVWRDSQLMADGRLRHGIQLLRFGGDSSLVGYRRYLSEIAAGPPRNDVTPQAAFAAHPSPSQESAAPRHNEAGNYRVIPSKYYPLLRLRIRPAERL